MYIEVLIMSRLTILICIFCFGLSFLLTACVKVNDGKLVNYQRKFQNLNKQEKKLPPGVIDLSDGQKVNYDIPFGTNFDIKY